MNVLITLTTAGIDTGPFNLYSNDFCMTERLLCLIRNGKLKTKARRRRRAPARSGRRGGGPRWSLPAASLGYVLEKVVEHGLLHRRVHGAPQKPLRGHHPAQKRSEFLNGLETIRGTRGLETAGRRLDRGNEQPIKTDGPGRHDAGGGGRTFPGVRQKGKKNQKSSI